MGNLDLQYSVALTFSILSSKHVCPFDLQYSICSANMSVPLNFSIVFSKHICPFDLQYFVQQTLTVCE